MNARAHGFVTVRFLYQMGDSKLPSLRAELSNALDKDTQIGYSACEIAMKYRIGKLPGAASIVTDLAAVTAGQGFMELPIGLHHGQVAGSLPGPHSDPFDRMLIAQAILKQLIPVSNEQPFDAYGVSRLW